MQPTSRAEAERLLGIAENLLEEKDLNAARDFALLAQETEPLLDGSDRIMAIADVLIAADKRINDNHHHWYAILQIDIHRKDDAELIKQQYRRLALLLHPDKNKFYSAESAFKLVRDAWAVLSDPSRKTAYDELFEFLKVDLDAMRNQREKENKNPREKMPVRRNYAKEVAAENIWTLCPYCYNLYEYRRAIEGYCLRCENCERAFQVVAIPPGSMPPRVPGREAYYCCWAYFPMGFAVGNSETAKTATMPSWMPPMFPRQVTSWPSADSLPKVSTVPLAESGEGFVGGTPPESRPMPQPQKNTDSQTTEATVPRKKGRPTKNPLS